MRRRGRPALDRTSGGGSAAGRRRVRRRQLDDRLAQATGAGGCKAGETTVLRRQRRRRASRCTSPSNAAMVTRMPRTLPRAGPAQLWATPGASATVGSWFLVSLGHRHATGANSYRTVVDDIEVTIEHDPPTGQARLSFTKDGQDFEITALGWLDRQLVRLVRSVSVHAAAIEFSDQFFTTDHKLIMSADPSIAILGSPVSRVAYATGVPAGLADTLDAHCRQRRRRRQGQRHQIRSVRRRLVLDRCRDCDRRSIRARPEGVRCPMAHGRATDHVAGHHQLVTAPGHRRVSSQEHRR